MLKVVHSHSYNNISAGPICLLGIEHSSRQALLFEKEFFPGACFTCAKVSTKVCLQRCAGCQLVAYCNKNCQKADWKYHKVLCKKYPVENGKNVIVRETESFGSDHRKVLYVLKDLQYTASQTCGPSSRVFGNVRVCGFCNEARPALLFDCRCSTTSYCSREHQMQDGCHWSSCNLLYGCALANWYLTQHHQLQIPDGLLSEANLNDGLKFKKVSKLRKYSSEKWLETIVNLINERLSFPLTICHALKTLKIGEQKKSLSEITSLTIHIVQKIPMLDPRMWEFFLHQLPKLKTLNLIFTSAIMRLGNKYNSSLKVERCSDCKRKQRVITYYIEPIHYHEYFSSKAYIPPDVVAVFGIDQELLINMMNIDKVNRFTSQRNMTYSKHTVVILTSFLEAIVEACVENFNDARPVKVLLPVQENPVRGFSTLRSNTLIMNENNHVCCIQGEH